MTTNVQFAAALRALAEIYEQHPEMAVPQSALRIWLTDAKREAFAATVRAIGSCEKLGQLYPSDDMFRVEKVINGVPVQFITNRGNVCRKVRVMKEVDDWDCSDPILEAMVPASVPEVVLEGMHPR